MEVKDKAEEHWEFLERWLHMVYVDTFIHGYKHGKENHLEGLVEKAQEAERLFQEELNGSTT